MIFHRILLSKIRKNNPDFDTYLQESAYKLPVRAAV